MSQNNEMLLAIQNLKANKNYQIIVNELNRIKDFIEEQIYDENTDDESRKVFVIKRNTIKNFIELPDDLIKGFEIKIANETNNS